MIELATLFVGRLLAVDNSSVNAQCGGTTCDTGLHRIGATGTQLHEILQIVFGTLAVIAVLMIVIAGLRFTLAHDDPKEAAGARNTIIYALIGLLIAVTAEAIVSFVLGNI